MFFCLLLHPKDNCGCLVIIALIAFSLVAPIFMDNTSMNVFAASLFIFGLFICMLNIHEVINKKSMIPFIGGLLIFLGIVSFQGDNMWGKPLVYYAQKYVYLFVFLDLSISMYIYIAVRLICNYLCRLLHLNVFDCFQPQSQISEDQDKDAKSN